MPSKDRFWEDAYPSQFARLSGRLVVVTVLYEQAGRAGCHTVRNSDDVHLRLALRA